MEENNWDKIIKSKRSLFSIDLKQIWNYRDLLRMLVFRDFVTYYKQTILGPIWFFIQPVFIVQTSLGDFDKDNVDKIKLKVYVMQSKIEG